MQKYIIKVTPNVTIALKEIYQSILKVSQSHQTAQNYVKDLEQTMQALNYFPERYRKTPSGNTDELISKNTLYSTLSKTILYTLLMSY